MSSPAGLGKWAGLNLQTKPSWGPDTIQSPSGVNHPVRGQPVVPPPRPTDFVRILLFPPGLNPAATFKARQDGMHSSRCESGELAQFETVELLGRIGDQLAQHQLR